MKTVARDRAPHYLARADAYFKTMELAFTDNAYRRSVPLLAVHSAIAFTDTITVARLGQRGIEHHQEAIEILGRLSPRKREGIHHLEWLLARKTRFTYGEKAVGHSEIAAAFDHAQKFFSWANMNFKAVVRSLPSGPAI